jgi:hypothetical protein
MHLIIIYLICALFPYPTYFKTVRGTKGLGQTLRYMIWTMVVLGFPSIAVLRTGRPAVVALIKCECLVMNEVIVVCVVFSIYVVSSIHSNPDNVQFSPLFFNVNLAAILVCHFTGEVFLEVASRNSDKPMVELQISQHGGKMRDLHSVSDEQMSAIFHENAP